MSLTFTPVEGGSVRDPWLFPYLLVFLLSYLPWSPGGLGGHAGVERIELCL